MMKAILAGLLLLLGISSAQRLSDVCGGGVLPGSNPALTRWPYLTAVTSSSAVVQWGTLTSVSAESAIASLVEEGSSKVISAPAKSYILSGLLAQDTQFFYAEVTGLRAGTRYCYSVVNNGTELAGGLHFKTAPGENSTETIRFVAIGDFGAGTPGQKKVRDAMNSKIEESDMFLALGDNVYLTGTQYQYDKFNFEIYKEQWAYLPLFLTIGNHDWYHDKAATYLRNFIQPREQGIKESDQGRFYSWDWGFVHFICLDTESSLDVDPSDPQSMISWLQKDLEETTKPWKIVIYHKPPYTQERIADERVVEKLVPIFEKYGVQVAMGGHWHNYQRFPTLIGETKVPMNQGGVLYITSGGGGYPVFGELLETPQGGWVYDKNKESPYPMYGMAPTSPDVFVRQQHFIYCQIDLCTFSIEAINEDMETIDNFTVSRC